MTGAELFDAAVKAAGGELELAHQLGYTNINTATTQFNRWRKGQTEMNFETTIRLLEIAGWLRKP